jgi:deoxyribose-phosphate aldolase
MFEDAGRLAQIIDHTLVRPDATFEDLAAACAEARQHGFAALIVNGPHVVRAKEPRRRERRGRRRGEFSPRRLQRW